MISDNDMSMDNSTNTRMVNPDSYIFYTATYNETYTWAFRIDDDPSNNRPIGSIGWNLFDKADIVSVYYYVVVNRANYWYDVLCTNEETMSDNASLDTCSQWAN